MNEPNDFPDSKVGRPARPSLVSPGPEVPGEDDGPPSAGGATHGPEAVHYPPEFVIAKTLHRRIVDAKLLREGECEAVAYRIAEIMVAAKDLYTVTLPRLTQDQLAGSDQLGLYEEIAGLRMALLHMRDLVSEFDAHFMDAMAIERADDETIPRWENPDDWSEEELEEEEP